jgi:hypothetical protein
MNYYVLVVSNEIKGVYQEGSSHPFNGVHPETGDEWRHVPVLKYDPSWFPLFNLFPADLTGSGTLPDIGDMTWDSGTKRASGALVPVPESRIISFRSFYKRIQQFGGDMDEIYTAAKSDIKVEQLLDLARNAEGGSTVDLDDQQTIDGMNYLAAIPAVPSVTTTVAANVLGTI